MSTMSKRVRALARPRRGQAIIETALVLPILVILVFGIVNVSMLMFDFLHASNCARDAARRAAVHLTPTACADLDFTLTVTDDGSSVTAVVADADYAWLVPIPPMTGTIPLSVSVVMRLEGEGL